MSNAEWVKARRKSDGKILNDRLPKHIVEASPLLSETPQSRYKRANSKPAQGTPSGPESQTEGEK